MTDFVNELAQVLGIPPDVLKPKLIEAADNTLQAHVKGQTSRKTDSLDRTEQGYIVAALSYNNKGFPRGSIRKKI